MGRCNINLIDYCASPAAGMGGSLAIIGDDSFGGYF
jgi:hypothetical protein